MGARKRTQTSTKMVIPANAINNILRLFIVLLCISFANFPSTFTFYLILTEGNCRNSHQYHLEILIWQRYVYYMYWPNKLSKICLPPYFAISTLQTIGTKRKNRARPRIFGASAWLLLPYETRFRAWAERKNCLGRQVKRLGQTVFTICPSR